MIRFAVLFLVLISANLNAQFYDSISNQEKDSLYLFEVQDKYEKDKVLHAEPLYIDLIRDLGARKGEKEWNVGFGLFNYSKFDAYEALVEYEWAVIDRLGLEIEVPVSFYIPLDGVSNDSIPSSTIESIKLAAQWSFLVSEKYATTLALGYIHEFEFSPFNRFGAPLFESQLFNPFFIGAKRWGMNFHSLVYTGPYIRNSFLSHDHSNSKFEMGYELHTNIHYMITGTRNFIGLELNSYFTKEDNFITLRPQMRVAISENLMIGIVPGVPIARKEKGLSMFLRLIWEPRHHDVKE